MKPLFEDAKLAKETPTARPVAAAADSVTPLTPLDAFSAQALTQANVPATVAPAQVAKVPAPRYNEDQIAQLGQQAAGGLSTVSTELLKAVKASDAGEFGQGLNELVGLAKGLDPSALKNKGLLGRVKGFISNAKEHIVAQYATVEKQIDRLTVTLDQKAALHRKRVGDMETMYTQNESYHEQLAKSVDAGQAQLRVMEADYEAAKLVAVNDSFGAQRLADHQRAIDRLSKRIDDLQRAMLLSKQAAPQIRLMQENARALVEKFGQVKAVTLPAWKNNFALYVLQLEQQESVKVLNAVDATTDEALRKNADLLRQNTAAIAEARQRSVVSVETLEHVQTQLLGSIEDVKRIEAEGKSRRAAEQPKLIEMERALIAAFAPNSKS